MRRKSKLQIGRNLCTSYKELITEYINNIGTLTNSVIPLDAFINGFKIIGIEKGLKNNELENFIQDCLISCIERTHYCFNIENCRNCFSKAKIEDIKKGVTKLK